MMTRAFRVPRMLVLLAASMPAVAQYVGTPPPPNESSAATRADELQVYPKNGQTQERQWADRYECHRWAKNQSGFDPTQQAGATPSSENASRLEGYRRAMTACLEGRGYAVRYGAPTQSATPPPPEPARVKQYPTAVPEFKYRPLSAQIDFGYTLTTGTTDQYLDNGPNVGFGFTWFPTPALPVGLRIDGSYSRFSARDPLLNLYGGDFFTSGHQNIYGGDADLQLDLAHRSSRAKMYLFGGVGWYREQTYLRQVTLEYGIYCDPYFCAPGYVPFLTASQRTTSPWHSSWNAGIGLELAGDANSSFFIEARYQRISQYNNKMQFVPIRMGLRF